MLTNYSVKTIVDFLFLLFFSFPFFFSNFPTTPAYWITSNDSRLIHVVSSLFYTDFLKLFLAFIYHEKFFSQLNKVDFIAYYTYFKMEVRNQDKSWTSYKVCLLLCREVKVVDERQDKRYIICNSYGVE